MQKLSTTDKRRDSDAHNKEWGWIYWSQRNRCCFPDSIGGLREGIRTITGSIRPNGVMPCDNHWSVMFCFQPSGEAAHCRYHQTLLSTQAIIWEHFQKPAFDCRTLNSSLSLTNFWPKHAGWSYLKTIEHQVNQRMVDIIRSITLLHVACHGCK